MKVKKVFYRCSKCGSLENLKGHNCSGTVKTCFIVESDKKLQNAESIKITKIRGVEKCF